MIASRSTSLMSLVAECLDGVESGRTPRGPETEEHAGDRGHAERCDHRTERDRSRDRCQRRHEQCEPATDHHPDRAADDRHRRGLEEELPEDLPLRGAERLADADLTRALRY